MKILIVIPCYNEEEVLPKTLDVLGALIRKIKKETDADTELLLVDDGSRDHTWQMISDAAKEHGYVLGIKLSSPACASFSVCADCLYRRSVLRYG